MVRARVGVKTSSLPSRAEGLDWRVEAPIVPHNLPVERTRFVGRETELEEAEALLRAGEVAGRLLTVVGTGGAGKTRFALKLAARTFADHPDGVWFVDLAPLGDPERVPSAVAIALSVREVAGVPLTRTLVDHLRERRALLVLDNCEHLLDGCRALAHELRAASPGLTVLATSREPLGVSGEQVYPLPPLATPSASEAAPPERLGLHASVALFVDRAQAMVPDFALDDSTARAVQSICRAMDGLPLAIELAAARVRVLTVNEIAARLDRMLALLRAPSGDTSRRHATMRATLEWSVQTLGDEEQRAFRALAVFASGWDLMGAGAVLDLDELDTLDRVDTLVNRSLVIAVSGAHANRYRFLEPVRQFAAELLDGASERPAAQRRLVEYFVGLSEEAGSALLGPDQSAWLDRIGVEHENLHAALDACQQLETAEPALRITGSLWRYWHVRGHLRAGLEAVRRALALPNAESTRSARAGALYAAGALTAVDMDGQNRSREYFEEALALSRAAHDDRRVAQCLTGLGAVASARREFAAGAERLREAQDIYRRLGDRRGLAVTLNNLGAAAWNQGDLERAETSISEALDLARAAGDLGNVAQLSVALSLIDTRLGRLGTAREHLRECLSTLCALGARHSSAAGALLASAELATRERRFPEVARWLGAADLVLERLGLVFDDSDVWWKEHQNCWAQARAELGEERAQSEYRSGRLIDRDDAMRLALADLETSVAR